MLDPLVGQILDVLAAADGGPVALRDLMARLGLTAKQEESFHHALDSLITADCVVPKEDGRAMALPDMKQQAAGVFHGTGRGFGFVTPLRPDKLGDLFIPPSDTLDAISGDLVMIRIIATDKQDSRGRSRTGRVIRILRRGTNRCVGTLARQLNAWVVIPDGSILKQPISIQDASAKSAAAGDKVVVELLEFPRAGKPAEGVITEVLGPHGEPEVELVSVIKQFDLPPEFPPEVLDQAGKAARAFAGTAAADREDISHLITVTIDPDDARDFDDAITLRVLDHGADKPVEDLLAPAHSNRPGPAVWELGVHIADVSHFVPVESPLDLEARKRGNSIYFPRYVIPMLPEVLSNGVCSLQENVPRLTKSVFIRYDRQGRVVSTHCANTVIRSHRRLTYTQAQAIIDDAKGQGRQYVKGLLESPPDPNVPQVAPPIRDLLVNMDRLARVIEQRRLDRGMIVLDLPEVELVMDATGRVIDAHRSDDAYTHKIIEMFMVEANEAVAEFLTRKHLNVLRRIHPDPDLEASENVRQFVLSTGRKLPQKLDRNIIRELLDSVRGTPLAYAIHLSVLKTFSTAEYSPLEQGHYALASANYAHFTSPIRRYADLVIHRLLDSVLTGGQKRLSRGKKHAVASAGAPTPEINALMPMTLGAVPDYNTLLRLARHLSFTERRAQDAERELRMVKVLDLLSQHIGDVIDGVVTGVNNSGVFVQSTRFLVEGQIRMNDLPPDYWIYDQRTACLRGQRTGCRITLGDLARVQIVAVNIPARRMEVRLIEHGSTIHGEKRLRKVEPARAPKPSKIHDSTDRNPGRRKHKHGKDSLQSGKHNQRFGGRRRRK
ncbi:MAG: ribonuclease R family protein [Phycisphaerae bacterium]